MHHNEEIFPSANTFDLTRWTDPATLELWKSICFHLARDRDHVLECSMLAYEQIAGQQLTLYRLAYCELYTSRWAR